MAYQQMTSWCWGWLGKKVRVVLPSCAVAKIRETFPSSSKLVLNTHICDWVYLDGFY